MEVDLLKGLDVDEVQALSAKERANLFATASAESLTALSLRKLARVPGQNQKALEAAAEVIDTLALRLRLAVAIIANDHGVDHSEVIEGFNRTIEGWEQDAAKKEES